MMIKNKLITVIIAAFAVFSTPVTFAQNASPVASEISPLLQKLLDQGIQKLQKGDNIGALAEFQKAWDSRDKKDQVLSAKLSHAISVLNFRSNRYDEAIKWLRVSGEIVEKLKGTNSAEAADNYRKLAAVYVAKGDLDSALTWFTKSTQALTVWAGNDPDRNRAANSWFALNSNGIATIHFGRGQYAEALNSFEQLEKYAIVATGEGSFNAGIARYKIAQCQTRMNDFNKALSSYLQAWKIFRSTRGEQAKHTTETEAAMESVYVKSGNKGDFKQWLKKQK